MVAVRAPVELIPTATECSTFQQRLKDLIGPYWGTYGIVYRVIQPLLVDRLVTKRSSRRGLRGFVDAPALHHARPPNVWMHMSRTSRLNDARPEVDGKTWVSFPDTQGELQEPWPLGAGAGSAARMGSMPERRLV